MLRRLADRFLGRLELEPIFWEHEPLLATASFQDQIVLPSETDVVVCILWSRLGTQLPAHIRRDDGSRYDSGTEFEFEDAWRGFRAKGSPQILVYRKTVEAPLPPGDDAVLESLRQKRNLDAFIGKWFHHDDGSLKAAFSPYQDLAEFEDQLDQHLEKLLVRKLVAAGDPDAAEAPPRWQEGSPYRGLETFDFEHAPVFFGRTRAVHEVLDALRAQAADGRAFVTILGMSGGGKSSLARAGVLPLLCEPGVIEGIGLWRRAALRPSDEGGDLAAALAAALTAPEALPELIAEDFGVAELTALLRAGRDPLEARLAPRVRSALERAAADLERERQLLERPAARLALLVDQVEELFTQEHLGDAERAAFAELLDVLARAGDVWVIATLRSDFYPRCGELPVLVELQKRDGQYHLLRPTPAELGQIIRKPAMAAGLTFDHDADADQGLDEVLRAAAAESPESLPLLEFTLEELYEQRDETGVLTFAAYERLGGVEGALARRAEDAFAPLVSEVQAALPRVLRGLVRVGRGEDAVSRKRADYARLCANDDARRLVDALVAARLLVTELDRDQRRTVSVGHEALLRHWPRLTAWLEEDREDLRVHGRVATAAVRWQGEERSPSFLLADGKPLIEAVDLERRWGDELSAVERELIAASVAQSKRRTRLKRGAVAALAILALVASLSAFIANAARAVASLRRGQAEDLITFMLGDLRDKLEPIGRQDVLGDVGDKAMDYFASLSEDDMSPAEIARQSLAMRQIGEVRVAQADLEAAMESFEEALARAQAVVDSDPESEDAWFDLAQVQFWIGTVHFYRGDIEEALDRYRWYFEIAQRHHAERPDDPRWLLELSYAHNNLGMVALDRDDSATALAEIRRSVEIKERLVALDPSQGSWREDLANGYAWLADVLDEQGESEAALGQYEKGLTVAHELVHEDSQHKGWQELLATLQNLVGDMKRRLGAPEDAVAHHRAAARQLKGLVAHDPTNSDWLAELAYTYGRLGSGWHALDETERAAAVLRQATAILSDLVELDPTQIELQRDLGLNNKSLAQVLELSDPAAAKDTARAAIDVFDRLLAEDPQDQIATLGKLETLLIAGRLWEGGLEPAFEPEAWVRVWKTGESLASAGDDSDRLLAIRVCAALYLQRDEASALADELRARDYPPARFQGVCRASLGETGQAPAP